MRLFLRLRVRWATSEWLDVTRTLRFPSVLPQLLATGQLGEEGSGLGRAAARRRQDQGSNRVPASDCRQAFGFQ